MVRRTPRSWQERRRPRGCQVGGFDHLRKRSPQGVERKPHGKNPIMLLVSKRFQRRYPPGHNRKRARFFLGCIHAEVRRSRICHKLPLLKKRGMRRRWISTAVHRRAVFIRWKWCAGSEPQGFLSLQEAPSPANLLASRSTHSGSPHCDTISSTVFDTFLLCGGPHA